MLRSQLQYKNYAVSHRFGVGMRQLIELGYIAKAFGLKGGVQVKLFSSQSESIRAGVVLTLIHKEKEQELTVADVLPQGRVFFAGIDDRTQAEGLQGGVLFIDRSDLPELDDDEFYLNDMIGASVQLADGTPVGTLVDFSSNNAQTLLEVKTIAGHVASIPLVDAIVKTIDAEQKVVIIDPPAGLLDP